MIRRGRNIYVEWYAPWSGPLSPARRRILNVFLLVAVPLALIAATNWSLHIPWGGSYGACNHGARPDKYIEPWKLEEQIVCETYHFTHEQYEAWLAKQYGPSMP